MGHIGFITNAFIEGCTIGPPAAIEYAVEPVEEEIIKPSPYIRLLSHYLFRFEFDWLEKYLLQQI